MIPNLTIVSPKDTEEFKKLLEFSETYSHPLAIRYPRSGKVVFSNNGAPMELGKWEYLEKQDSANVTVLATGERCLTIAMQILQRLKEQGKSFDVVNARFVKPLDEELLFNLQSGYVVTLEDNVYLGGFGAMVDSTLKKLDKSCKIKSFAYRDTFIPQGKVKALQDEYGVNEREIEDYILEIMK